jgi:hypothetical protein
MIVKVAAQNQLAVIAVDQTMLQWATKQPRVSQTMCLAMIEAVQTSSDLLILDLVTSQNLM